MKYNYVQMVLLKFYVPSRHWLAPEIRGGWLLVQQQW